MRDGTRGTAEEVQAGGTTADAGFTLVEMLVVLAILGMATAAMAVGLRPPSDERLVRELAAEVRRELSLARMDALRIGAEVAVRVDVRDRTIRRDGGGVIDVPERITLDATVGRERTGVPSASRPIVPTGSTLASLDGEGVGAIVFLPGGGSSGGRITLTAGDAQRQVGIHWLTGIARIEP